MHRLRAAGVALMVMMVVLGAGLSGAAALTQTPNVIAQDSRGRVLPLDPLLRPGEVIRLTITGFAPNAVTRVRLGSSKLADYKADRTGRLRFAVRVPTATFPGHYVIAAVGDPPITTHKLPSASASASGDRQYVEALVPNLGLFPFHVGTASSSPPATSSTPPGSAQPTSGSSGGTGGLGHTGTPVLQLLLIGVIGVVGGWLVLLSSRRRYKPKRA
jgi:hypothetical protein